VPAISSPRPDPPPSPSTLWLEGAGAAILLVLPLIWLHIAPLHTDLYHRLLPMNTVYRGALLDLLAAILLSTVVFWILHRRDPDAKSLGWLLVIAVLLMRTAACLGNAELLSRRISPNRVFFASLLAGLLLWFLRRSWYAAAMRIARTLILLVGFAIIWILPQLAWMAFHAEPRDPQAFAKPVAQPPSQRIVWILFDEASYDQIFDHRYPSLSLPSFDRLAAQSVAFSDVQPSGYYTELVVPSLLQGQIVTAERSDLEGHFSVRYANRRGWHPYPVDQTLFADAQRNGWSTAAAGWYIPYCRVFAAVLDDCYWKFTDPIAGNYEQSQSTLWNALAPVRKPLLRLAGIRTPAPTTAQVHEEDFDGILQHARAMIADDGAGFVFIHLPVPHPAGFYNRRTGAIGVPGSYIDNLALADRTLGELLQQIAQTPPGNKTTVIVSSDHSWRVAMWRSEFDWTAEDEAASRNGHFDPRPVILVHFPGQQTGAKMSQPFPLIRMHAMIDQMLAGKMTNAAALQTWATQP
jgi:Sulfatase